MAGSLENEEKRSSKIVYMAGDSIKRGTDVGNEGYEVVTGVSEKFLFEFIESEASKSNTQNIDFSTASLESFTEHRETIGKHWIERIIQETRPLAQWLQQETENFQNKGVAFVQCPLPHPYDDLPMADNNIIKEDFDNRNSFTLETALSKISKGKRGKYKCSHIEGEEIFHLDVKTRGSDIHGVPPTVAIENYCQQHAYSRARLMRTDRRELANELLEQMSAGSESAEILAARSSKSDSPLISTGAVAPTHSEKDFVKRKETGNNKTIRKNSFVEEINEPLRISPCVFFPNVTLSESKKKFIRRHKSVPRFISKSSNQ